MPNSTNFISCTVGPIADLLQANDISPTAQRIQIADVLLSQRQHLSADQVIARLDEMGTMVSKATVYNTLGLFAERGLIRQVIVDPTKVFYDSNIEDHHHFYNVDDGTLTDVPVIKLPIDDLPCPPEGTDTVGVDIVIRTRNKR
ncbi:MAG: Fur family iron response transcriptional regulator [Gammaproteobacteria bacterium]|jgi:Fur family iron response transcriptional regulator